MIFKFEIGLKSSLYPNDLELKKDFYYIKVIFTAFCAGSCPRIGKKISISFFVGPIILFYLSKTNKYVLNHKIWL